MKSVNRAIGRRVCGSMTAVGAESTERVSPPMASGAANVVDYEQLCGEIVQATAAVVQPTCYACEGVVP